VLHQYVTSTGSEPDESPFKDRPGHTRYVYSRSLSLLDTTDLTRICSIGLLIVGYSPMPGRQQPVKMLALNTLQRKRRRIETGLLWASPVKIPCSSSTPKAACGRPASPGVQGPTRLPNVPFRTTTSGRITRWNGRWLRHKYDRFVSLHER
jgi:hypothetical protein